MKILAVDNHPVMLRFIEKLLTKEGHEVRTASDGLAALQILKSYVPDVMFVDLIMPKIDGKKLCLVVRQKEELKDVHIVVLSAVAVEEAADYKEFGADACIAKGPFDMLGPDILEVLDILENGEFRQAGGIRGKDYVFQWAITKELIYSRRHFEVILNNMSEGLLEVTQEGYIFFANPASSKIMDIPEGRLLGANFFELFEEPERSRIQAKFSGVLQTMTPYFSEKALETNQRKILFNVLPVVEEEGNEALVILEDITDKMKIEAQLKHAKKMEAIGTLSGGIAHDFNNLLMGIQGNISVMLLETKPTHLQYECIKKIENIIKSGSELTDKLLGYARKGKYELKIFDLNNLVQQSSEMFGRAKREVSIERNLADDLMPIEGDRVQFEQVLLNLYVNAWQAMPEGGTIRIETRNVSHKEIGSTLFKPKPGKYVKFVVSDTGTGIDEAVVDRVFDPFFTTKELGRGTGLGLASAYGIIKNHGGYIDVDSKKGEGTTFYLFIPASEKALSESEAGHRVAPEGDTILLADDEDCKAKTASSKSPAT